MSTNEITDKRYYQHAETGQLCETTETLGPDWLQVSKSFYDHSQELLREILEIADSPRVSGVYEVHGGSATGEGGPATFEPVTGVNHD